MPGFINCNYLADAAAELEGEASDAAAQVECASAFLEGKNASAFVVDTLMKSQQDILEMVKVRAKVPGFPVMKKDILVEVTIGFVGVGTHVVGPTESVRYGVPASGGCMRCWRGQSNCGIVVHLNAPPAEAGTPYPE